MTHSTWRDYPATHAPHIDALWQGPSTITNPQPTGLSEHVMLAVAWGERNRVWREFGRIGDHQFAEGDNAVWTAMTISINNR
jgi:hypothetical protein